MLEISVILNLLYYSKQRLVSVMTSVRTTRIHNFHFKVCNTCNLMCHEFKFCTALYRKMLHFVVFPQEVLQHCTRI